MVAQWNAQDYRQEETNIQGEEKHCQPSNHSLGLRFPYLIFNHSFMVLGREAERKVYVDYVSKQCTLYSVQS
ncbi:MAG: hypothetical protein ACK559_18290, partial [bacterium]